MTGQPSGGFRGVVGLRASVAAEVGEADTAASLGSGDLPVLGTPRLLALAEAACVAAVLVDRERFMSKAGGPGPA